MTEQLTFSNYGNVNESKVPVVIDFYADWCPPCKMLSPVLDSLEKKYGSKVKFMKLDVDNESVVSNQFEIQSLPTIVVLRDGHEIGRIIGYLPEDVLKEKIDSALKNI